jgi:hypothetical protein
VDYVSSGILAVSWATTAGYKQRREREKALGYRDRVKIYHMGSSGVNPTTWGAMGELVLAVFRHSHYKSKHAISHRPWQRFVDGPFLYAIAHCCFHLTPALMYDWKLMLIDGKKPRMLDSMRKLNVAVSSLFYFTSHSWWFRNENILDLLKRLNEEDRYVLIFFLFLSFIFFVFYFALFVCLIWSSLVLSHFDFVFGVGQIFYSLFFWILGGNSCVLLCSCIGFVLELFEFLFYVCPCRYDIADESFFVLFSSFLSTLPFICLGVYPSILTSPPTNLDEYFRLMPERLIGM